MMESSLRIAGGGRGVGVTGGALKVGDGGGDGSGWPAEGSDDEGHGSVSSMRRAGFFMIGGSSMSLLESGAPRFF